MSVAKPRFGPSAIARPLYSQVRDLMMDRIDNGIWAVGSSLPNEFQLSAEFGVSVGTIRRAVEGLEEAGILMRKQGRGTFVAGSPAGLRHVRLYPFRLPDGQFWQPNFDPAPVLSRAATRDEMRHVGVAGQDLIVIERAGRHAGTVVLVEMAIMPARLLPELRALKVPVVDFRKAQADAGLDIAKVIDVLTAPGHDQSKVGHFPSASLIMRVDRRMLDSSDRVLEWGTCWLDTAALSFVSERQ